MVNFAVKIKNDANVLPEKIAHYKVSAVGHLENLKFIPDWSQTTFYAVSFESAMFVVPWYSIDELEMVIEFIKDQDWDDKYRQWLEKSTQRKDYRS